MKPRIWVDVKVFVVLAVLCGPVHAEYQAASNPAGVTKDLAKVEKALGSLDKAKKRKGALDNSFLDRSGIEEALKSVQEQVKANEEEIALSNKTSKWANKIDKQKFALTLPTIFQTQVDKRREAKTKEVSQLFAQMPSSPAAFDPNDFNMNGIEKSCKKGVDFSGFKSLREQLTSDPFQYIKEQGLKLAQEKEEDAKEQRLANIEKMFTLLDKLGDQKAPEFDEQVGPVGALDQDNSSDARLDRLKQTAANQKSEIEGLNKKLRDEFKSLITKASQTNENDARIAQLANHFADHLESYRTAAHQSLVNTTAKLTENCENLSEKIGDNGNPLEPNTMFNSAYQWMVRYNTRGGFYSEADAADYQTTTQFLQQAQSISNKLDCTDVNPQVEAIMGGTLKAEVDKIRSATDPETLIQGAMATMNAVASKMTEVNAVVQPLMEDCQFAAKTAKNLEQFVAQMAPETKRQQDEFEQLVGGPRGPVTPGQLPGSGAQGFGGAGNGTTHGGALGGFSSGF